MSARGVPLPALGVVGGIVAGILLAAALTDRRTRDDVLFAPTFPARGLVTNEFAHWNAGHAKARASSDWTVTSGSLFARDGGGWTGRPDRTAPDAGSRDATDSAVFRLRSNESDFGDVAVSFALKLNRLVTTARTRARDWDGVHVWLRYASPDTLYYVSVGRRDGEVVIGKKLDGRYTRLSVRRGEPLAPGRWNRVETTIVTESDGMVTIRLLVDGALVERVTDEGASGSPITAPGRIGLRGDNADFEFRDLTVRRVS